jgi:hypothetical protein
MRRQIIVTPFRVISMVLLAWNTEFISAINDHQGEGDTSATGKFSRRGQPEVGGPQQSSSSGNEILSASSPKKLMVHCT